MNTRTKRAICRISRSLAATVPLLVLTSCTYFVKAIAKHAESRVVSREFQLRVQKTPLFVRCLEEPGGACKAADAGDLKVDFFSGGDVALSMEPLDTSMRAPVSPESSDADIAPSRLASSALAALATDVLNHDVQRQLNSLFDIARGVNPGDTVGRDLINHSTAADGSTAVEMNIDLAQFLDYEQDIEAATLLGAWDALERETATFDVSEDSARRARYVSSYFRAYFRNGRFFKATLDASKLKERLVEKAKELVPGLRDDDDYEALASRIFSQLSFNADSGYVFGAIQEGGFITRGGQTVRFPAIELSATLGESKISSSDVDYIAVGSDLIRVFLHAIFDAKMRLPAVSSATGVSIVPDGLVVNDGDSVDEDEFERIETLASQVEGVIAAGTGRLLRGISFFSLNNEALASALETAVGVAVRKQAEKAAWCWYSCGFNDAHPETGDYAAVGFGQSIHLTISVSGLALPTP